MSKPSSIVCAASLITNLQGECLVVWNPNYSGWGLPSGKQERDERLGETQRRELKEETGLSTVLATWIYGAEGQMSRTGASIYVHVYHVIAFGNPRAERLTPAQALRGNLNTLPDPKWMSISQLRSGPDSAFPEFYHAMFKHLGV